MRVEEALKNVKTKINNTYKNYEKNDKGQLKAQFEEQLDNLYREQHKLQDIICSLKPLKDPIINAIRYALDMSTGENFKMYVSFQELIDYKTDWKRQGENEKFKRFVVFIDSVQTQLKFVYPFIDLSDIDLSWTTNQLVDYILDAYFSMPTISVKQVEKIRIESNSESIAEDIIRNMLAKEDKNDN